MQPVIEQEPPEGLVIPVKGHTAVASGELANAGRGSNMTRSTNYGVPSTLADRSLLPPEGRIQIWPLDSVRTTAVIALCETPSQGTHM